MAFILVSETRGDELIHPVKTMIAASDDRLALEHLLLSRETDREQWLKDNPLPDYVLGSVIDREWIEEILSV